MKQFQIGSFFALNDEAMDRLSYIAEKLECSQLEALDKSIDYVKKAITDLIRFYEINVESPDSEVNKYEIVENDEN